MRQGRDGFRLTKRGKTVVALVSTAFILTGTYALRGNTIFNFTFTSNPDKSIVNASAEVDRQYDNVNFQDKYLADIVAQYKPGKVAKNNNTSAVNNKNVSMEIDEEFFSRSLFIGDSITEGIAAYGLLDGSNILAVKGLTISKAEKEMETIVKRKPERIYILLGSNDLLYGMDSEKFSTSYLEFIHNIKDKLPETKIYIQSIFPVSRDVESKKPLLSNARIDEFNRNLKSQAENQGIQYIDISNLLKDGSGIMNQEYSSDGIHVKYKFYSIWLDCVKRNS